MIRVSVYTHGGIGKSNEDYALHLAIAPEIDLVIVCDGMGGLSCGNAAARLVAHGIAEYFAFSYSASLSEQSLVDAIIYANEIIAKEACRLHCKMGASVGVAMFVGSHCSYSWLGDVRIYHRQNYVSILLTKDHLAIPGNHLFITRSINGKPFRHPVEVRELTLSPGDEILIATDGYYLHRELPLPADSWDETEDDATLVRCRFK